MRIRIKLSIDVGKEPAPVEDERYVDAIGTQYDTGPTDTYLGFTTPANDGATT